MRGLDVSRIQDMKPLLSRQNNILENLLCLRPAPDYVFSFSHRSVARSCNLIHKLHKWAAKLGSRHTLASGSDGYTILYELPTRSCAGVISIVLLQLLAQHACAEHAFDFSVFAVTSMSA